MGVVTALMFFDRAIASAPKMCYTRASQRKMCVPDFIKSTTFTRVFSDGTFKDQLLIQVIKDCYRSTRPVVVSELACSYKVHTHTHSAARLI